MTKKTHLGSAVFVGCIKNSEQYLPQIFENLERLNLIFEKTGYIFIENDSIDDTKHMLNKWGANRDNFHVHSLDGLDNYEKSRTIRLEITRNAYINLLKKNVNLCKFDFMIVLDMDDIAIYPIDLNEFKQSLLFLKADESRAGVFANQENNYYDLWALRDRNKYPKDFWHAVLINILEGMSEDESFKIEFEKIPHFFNKTAGPIEIDSAFGGLGIYKIQYVLNNKFSYVGHSYLFLPSEKLSFTKLQTCEHVTFNFGILEQGGKLYIYPSLINSNQNSSINRSAYKSLIIR